MGNVSYTQIPKDARRALQLVNYTVHFIFIFIFTYTAYLFITDRRRFKAKTKKCTNQASGELFSERHIVSLAHSLRTERRGPKLTAMVDMGIQNVYVWRTSLHGEEEHREERKKSRMHSKQA